MTERLQQKIARVKQYLDIVHRMQSDCVRAFDIDEVYRGAMLHYLYLIADSCIAIAGILIRIHKLRPAQTYHEIFDILGEARILDPEFVYEFAKIAGFRNFLAHDYEDVDAKMICGQVLSSLSDVEEFLRIVDGV